MPIEQTPVIDQNGIARFTEEQFKQRQDQKLIPHKRIGDKLILMTQEEARTSLVNTHHAV